MRYLYVFLFLIAISTPAAAEEPYDPSLSWTSSLSWAMTLAEHVRQHTRLTSKGPQYRLRVEGKDVPTYFEVEGPYNRKARRPGLRFRVRF